MVQPVNSPSVDAVLGGKLVRETAPRFSMVPSTLSRQIQKVRQGYTKGPDRHNILSAADDNTLLGRVNTFTALSLPLDRSKLTALTNLLVESRPIDRQAKTAFTYNSMGKA